MASLRRTMTPDENGSTPYDIAAGNGTDSDRHGVVIPDGLMNPNYYLAVVINYLSQYRPGWKDDAVVGKTLISFTLINRVIASAGRKFVEVPAGFKYFVPDLLGGFVDFDGEESVGVSFLRKDGTVWSTDRDGIILALLALETLTVIDKTPSQLYAELTERFGTPVYVCIDVPANRKQKAKPAALSPEDATATGLAGGPITTRLTCVPGNDAVISDLKATTGSAWFAACPSGIEDVYKTYAESFKGTKYLAEVQEEAKKVVSDALG